MSKSNSISVKVPATTANIGPGFDCLGAAVSLYNEFEFSLTQEKTSFTVSGIEGEKISLTEDNLLYQSFLKFYAQTGQEIPSVKINIKVGVPLARGLGSSATAIVGGLLGANYFAPQPLSNRELMNLAIAIEGHPDNVIPAFMGNCILSVGEGENWNFVPVNCNPDIAFVLAIPDFELSTEEARAVLPASLSYGDAVFNIARLGLLIRALDTGNGHWLWQALDDKLHQPYRSGLIKGYEEVKQAVLRSGGYGMVISGAGPTLLALCSQSDSVEVSEAMKCAWQNVGIIPMVRSLFLDREGAKISEN